MRLRRAWSNVLVTISICGALTVLKEFSQETNSKVLTLHGRQTQLLRNLRISNLARFLQRHPPHQLGQIATARNCAAAPECLEFDVADCLVGRVDANLKLHHVATGRGTDKARADV